MAQISAECSRQVAEEARQREWAIPRFAKELADLFGRQSRLRIEQLFAALWRNEDSRNYKAAQQMLEGRYSWLEDGLVGALGTRPPIPTSSRLTSGAREQLAAAG